MDKKEFDKMLTTYLQEPAPREVITTFSGHLSKLHGNMNSREQFEMMSSVSNYHVLGYPSIVNPQKFVATKDIKIDSHILTPDNKRVTPSSPRNRILYFINSGSTNHLSTLVRYINLKDIEMAIYPHETPEPRRKKRKLAARASKKIDQVQLRKKYMSPELLKLVRLSNVDRSVYSTFSNQMMTSGTIKWRYNQMGRNVCVMNEYTLQGHLIPNSFVHISAEIFDETRPVIRCTCEVYNFLQNIDPDENLELSHTTSCMHCRFFNDHLRNAYEVISEGHSHLPRPLEIIKGSIQFMNDEVLLLGDILPSGTTKYSVNGNDTFSIINLNFTGGICYVKCNSGSCAGSNINKKKIPRKTSLSDTAKLCSHLRVFSNNLDTVRSSFPHYFINSNENPDDDTPDNPDPTDMNLPDEDLNTEDDATLNNTLESNFNKETGLWSYKRFSEHKPMFAHNEHLIECTRDRMKAVLNFDPQRLIEMKHIFKNPDGTPRVCDCGSIFTEESNIEEGIARLYTRVGVVRIRYYTLKCQAGRCERKFEIVAATEGIFFYTRVTCAGDEIGWDFINRVKTTKISFTAFCDEMTRFYKTTNLNSEPFMNKTTFIGWFFGWLSAFKIDFRKEIDPFCGHTPKILACDGTHIGVSLRHMHLENPVTKNDIETEIPWKHGRVKRRLFEDNNIRTHIKYMSMKYLNILKDDTLVTEMQANDLSITVMGMLTPDPPLKEFLRQFLFQTVPDDVLKVQAELLYQLSGEYQISSVLPPRAFDTMLNICNKLEHKESCCTQLHDMRVYNAQISDLVHLSLRNSCIEVIPPFFKWLIKKIKEIHAQDLDPTPVEEIPNSYDPPSGNVYYFSESGNQMRKMPKYEKNKAGKDTTEDSSDGMCQKKYPTVSAGGYSYMFLWFCPIHGHSYGFHLIDGAEGPKDVFSSLLKYKEEMPLEIFYDNACHLSEYCLNREPSLFFNTRFWHDLFHAIGHICGVNFKSTRVEGLGGINSEICEQVNAYLQCIKYTGAHLSQEHFIFFMQFFLYLLNLDKTERQGKLCDIALAGMD